MEFNRHFVPAGTDPFSLFKYEEHETIIRHHVTGEVMFQYVGEVPKHWSVNARDVVISKYFRKGGVPDLTVEVGTEPDMPAFLRRRKAAPDVQIRGEKSIKEVLHRIVGAWAYHGFTNGYFNEEGAKAFYDEQIFISLNQMGAPNSPQWFNTGLNWAYGINGPKQGHWYVNLQSDTRYFNTDTENLCTALRDGTAKEARSALEERTCRSPDAYSLVQAHACFILNVKDTMFNGEDGIFEWYNAEGLIFKYGSGSGANLSKLRAEGERLSGGGKSSGLMSWVKVADYSAGAIKSGGTTRRAAKMVCLDVNHPDIRKFIECKVDSELTVAGLAVGSAAVTVCCQAIINAIFKLPPPAATKDNIAELYELVSNRSDVIEQMQTAAEAGVPHNYIDKAIRWALEGNREWPGHTFNTEYEGEAYATVPFQNANNSVRLTQGFYDLCDKDGDWSTIWRTNGKVAWTAKARQLEHEIAEATWFCGDPGAQFDTNINEWNVTPADGTIDASNPCSEHMRLNDSGCNLASLCLTSFYHHGEFHVSEFLHAINLYQTLLDVTICMSHLPTKGVAMGVYNYRDTGLGYCDLGALIMSMGLAYDSDEGRAVGAAITALMQAQAHLTSAKIAAQLGPYPRWYVNREHHLRCVRNHMAVYNGDSFEGLTNPPPRLDQSALHRALGNDAAEQMIFAINETFDEAYDLASITGFRNAEMTVLAPTGTISFVMEADTTGVEPMLAVIVYKTLAGGGTMVVEAADCVRLALTELGYNADKVMVDVKTYLKDRAEVGERASADAVQDIIRRHVAPEHHSVFDTSLGKYAIPWQAHVKMMGATQAFLSGAISKTVNMPSHATVDEIRQAYRMANDIGVKALAVYRDGSKLSQPLNIQALKKLTDDVKPQDAEEVERLSPETPSGGRMLLGWLRNPGIDIRVKLGYASLYLRTTRYPDGRCAEIWATYSADQGIIMALIGSIMKTANIAIQWGVPLEQLIDSWNDTVFDPRGPVGLHPYITQATSLLNLIGRLLDYHELGNTSSLNKQPTSMEKDETFKPAPVESVKHPKVTISGETCPNCGCQQFISSGANCKKCLNCGSAGGCG